MRWLAYLILAYVVLGLQVGLAPYLAFQGASPNLVLLCVIFMAINAGREPALLACFGLGAMQDMLTQSSLGLYAFSYALVGMFVVATQELVFREHPLTHFFMALSGGILTALMVLLHEWARPSAPAMRMDGAEALPALRVSLAMLFATMLYTAALAVPVLGALQRTRRLFAFDTARRKSRM